MLVFLGAHGRFEKFDLQGGLYARCFSPMWLRVTKRYPRKGCPGKWTQGLKPAVPPWHPCDLLVSCGQAMRRPGGALSLAVGAKHHLSGAQSPSLAVCGFCGPASCLFVMIVRAT